MFKCDDFFSDYSPACARSCVLDTCLADRNPMLASTCFVQRLHHFIDVIISVITYMNAIHLHCGIVKS